MISNVFLGIITSLYAIIMWKALYWSEPHQKIVWSITRILNTSGIIIFFAGMYAFSQKSAYDLPAEDLGFGFIHYLGIACVATLLELRYGKDGSYSTNSQLHLQFTCTALASTYFTALATKTLLGYPGSPWIVLSGLFIGGLISTCFFYKKLQLEIARKKNKLKNSH